MHTWKPSFKSTNYYNNSAAQRPSALQRTTSSRDITSLSSSSNSSPPSPSGNLSASSPSRSTPYPERSSPTKNATGRRSLDAHSSPPRAQSHSHSRTRSASASLSPYEPDASPTRTARSVRPWSSYPSKSGNENKLGSGNGKENSNGNENSKHLYAGSRIPTPTPTPTSPPSPRSQPQNPQNSNRRVTPNSSRISSPNPRSESNHGSDATGNNKSAKPSTTYAELISTIKSLCSPSPSLPASSLPRRASPPASTAKDRGSLGLGSPPQRALSSSPSSSSSSNPASSTTSTTPTPNLPSSQSQTRPRVPSRTQLRHATAARRLSAEGLLPLPVSVSTSDRVTTPLGSGTGNINDSNSNKKTRSKNENVLPDDPQDISTIPSIPVNTSSAKTTPSPSSAPNAMTARKVGLKKEVGPSPDSEPSNCPSWTGLRALSHSRSNSSPNPTSSSSSKSTLGSKVAHWRRSSAGGDDYSFSYSHPGLKRKQIDTAPDVSTPPPPYLWKTLQVANVKMLADSANMETLMGNREVLGASYVTPQSILDKLHDSDNYYHVWVAVKLALEEKPFAEHGMEEVTKLAFTKLLVELGAALNDCLHPNPNLLAHYTFVDPRKLMHPDGMQSVLDQAVAVVEGLEKKGLNKERIYISIPAMETGLAIAKVLKEMHGIKTNLTFVSNLAQASICASVAGAAAITMPVDDILTYHESKNCLEYDEMSPHPGWLDIKSTACYLKHHNVETQVIGSGWRSLEELEHCASLTSICISDSQFVRARWHRTRINRPPAPTSGIATLAQDAPFPPPSDEFGEDGFGIRYISHIGTAKGMGGGPEVRDQCAKILHTGLKSWQEAAEKLHDVLCWELGRQMYLWVKPRRPCGPFVVGEGYGIIDENAKWGERVDKLSEEPVDEDTVIMRDLEQYERSRLSRSQSPQRWGEPRVGTAYRASDAFSSPPSSRFVETRKRTQRRVHPGDQTQDEEALQEIQIEFPPKESQHLHSEWDEWDDDELDERVRRYERGASVLSVGTSTSTNAGSVPPSPYWTDADAFESESTYENNENECGSTSSSSDDDEDMIMIA